MEFDGSLYRGYACTGVHKLGNAYTGFQLLDDCQPCGFNGNCLPIDIVSIKVGTGKTNANFRVQNPAEVRMFIKISGIPLD